MRDSKGRFMVGYQKAPGWVSPWKGKGKSDGWKVLMRIKAIERHPTYAMRDEIFKMYATEGMKVQEIADKLGVGRHSVTRRLKEKGVKIKGLGGFMKGRSPSGTHLENLQKYWAMRRAMGKRPPTIKAILDDRMCTAIRRAILTGKNGRKWSDLVDYSVSDLIGRLSDTMPQGYSWERIGEMHIDHIIPKSLFKYESENDLKFKECWALANLQLLPAMENISKGNRI